MLGMGCATAIQATALIAALVYISIHGTNACQMAPVSQTAVAPTPFATETASLSKSLQTQCVNVITNDFIYICAAAVISAVLAVTILNMATHRLTRLNQDEGPKKSMFSFFKRGKRGFSKKGDTQGENLVEVDKSVNSVAKETESPKMERSASSSSGKKGFKLGMFKKKSKTDQ
ncbi:hypothetical protein HDU98_005871 [Podochytrium sp. JEL0797]|nr:hypothetical protein HDU98_005871 [Podochytrium sp. JEL0797]